MKKLLSLALSLIMVLSAALMPFAASAASKTPAWDKYSKNGSHKVSDFTFNVDGFDFTYRVWYPTDITSQAPVILYCNGTGSNYEKSPETAQFLSVAASHGFICLTNTDENCGTGASTDAGMTKLIELSQTPDCPLYRKVNINNVGLAGHSQGATCTINLSSKGKYENLKHFKAVYACSLPTPQLAASSLQNCPYDVTLASLPTLLVAGTGATDSGFICPYETSLLPAIKNINNDVIMARMSGVEHADSIGKTFPYMIAWFDYKLNKNSEAGKAFLGKSPELKTNTDWQDYKTKIVFKEKAALSKVTAGKKSFKANWKKCSGITGYEIQYSTSSKFTKKTTASVTVKSAKTTAKTVKKLKAKKKYFVRVRAYRSICGAKYYGKWSAVKKVKTI